MCNFFLKKERAKTKVFRELQIVLHLLQNTNIMQIVKIFVKVCFKL